MKTFSNISEYLKQYDSNSTTNQNIKSKLVDREVIECQTSLIDWVLSKEDEVSDPFYTMDEISNYYSYPEFSDEYGNYFEGGNEVDKNERIREIELEIEHQENLRDEAAENEDEEAEADADAEIEQLEAFKDDLENIETEPAEIYEWWSVTSWFANRLEEYGESILNNGIWGRQTTGQAILLDYVITKIAFDMGILEGQSNSWE